MENSCEESTISKKSGIIDNTLGLLDAAFAHLNKLHMTSN
jgi:hypothetical protein